MAIPTGHLADLIGRRKITALILTGILCGNLWILLICESHFSISKFIES